MFYPDFIHLKTEKGWEKSEDREEAEKIQQNMGKNKRKDQLFPSKTWNLTVTNVLLSSCITKILKNRHKTKKK